MCRDFRGRDSDGSSSILPARERLASLEMNRQQLTASPLLTDFHLLEPRLSRTWPCARTQRNVRLFALDFRSTSSHCTQVNKCPGQERSSYTSARWNHWGGTADSATHPVRRTRVMDSVTLSCSNSNSIPLIELNHNDYKLK